jgi:cyanophycin synthetase
MGRRVGMTSTDGIVIDGRLIKKGDMSGPRSAQMVLQNPTVDTAVFEVARGGILREGLGYDRNDVAVVTNITGDHLGLGGIDTIGQLANVKGVIVEAVPRSGTAVLNADDGHVYRMGRHCAGRVVLFSMSTQKGEDGYDRVDGHTSRGNAAFVLQPGQEGELIVLRHWPRTMPVLYTHLIPATFGGRARMNVPTPSPPRQRPGPRAHARHPAGPADLLDVVLPGTGPTEPDRDERLPRDHRLLPQRRRRGA